MVHRSYSDESPDNKRPQKIRHCEAARPPGIARGCGNLALCLLLTVTLAHAQTPTAPVVPGAHGLLNELLGEGKKLSRAV